MILRLRDSFWSRLRFVRPANPPAGTKAAEFVVCVSVSQLNVAIGGAGEWRVLADIVSQQVGMNVIKRLSVRNKKKVVRITYKTKTFGQALFLQFSLQALNIMNQNQEKIRMK